MPESSVEPRAQPGFWRWVDRLERLIYRNGWPARLARRLGHRPVVRVAEHAIELSAGVPEARTLTVAFASDFHAGPTTSPELLRQAAEALEAVRPDVLLLGGDFVSLDVGQIDWLAPLLGRIPAPLGRFAVLGNHDHWNGADRIVRALEAAGIEVLTNRNRRLAPPFQNVWICGLDDFVSGVPNATLALSGADGARLVLMHAPGNLRNLDGERFDLALCGHTHGGQLALPGGMPITVAPGPLSRVYSRGRFPLPRGGTLLVSVGLGCSTVPLRVNSSPEILLCRIGTRSPGAAHSREKT
ncbi:MAG TPA: metallophosphoesterase [Gemmatimonadales bacterium]|nr:metallophosphoesterase [Gemmatimonadales bacterium]